MTTATLPRRTGRAIPRAVAVVAVLLLVLGIAIVVHARTPSATAPVGPSTTRAVEPHAHPGGIRPGTPALTGSLTDIGGRHFAGGRPESATAPDAPAGAYAGARSEWPPRAAVVAPGPVHVPGQAGQRGAQG